MPSGFVDRSKPLRPLSRYARLELRRISAGSVLPHTVNPGVRDRLFRGGLIEGYTTGRPLCITEAGRVELGAA